MSDETRERLSALMDGELAEVHARRTFDQMTDSDELRATWERYHLIGDVVRERIGPASLGERVRARIEAEPVVLAARRRPRFARPMPMAIAASMVVAVAVGVLIGGALSSEAPIEVAATPPALPSSPAPGLPAAGAVLVVERGQDRWNGGVQANVARQLNNYVVNHNERGGMPGMHPYARIVSYEQQRYQ